MFIDLVVVLAGWFNTSNEIMKQYTTNGLSIQQLKKDAKRLKKTNNITLSDAQNNIAVLRTPYASWSKMMHASSLFGRSLSRFSFTSFGLQADEGVTLFSNRPLGIIEGEMGTGKSLLAQKLLLNSGFSKSHVLVCDFRSVFRDTSYEFYSRADEVCGQITLLAFEDYLSKFSDSNYWSESAYLIEVLKKVESGKYGSVLFDEVSRFCFSAECQILLAEVLRVCSKRGVSIVMSYQLAPMEFRKLIQPYLSFEITHDRAMPVSAKEGSSFKLKSQIYPLDTSIRLTI